MAKVLTKQAMALNWTLWKSLSYRFYLLSHVPLTLSYHKASFWRIPQGCDSQLVLLHSLNYQLLTGWPC